MNILFSLLLLVGILAAAAIFLWTRNNKNTPAKNRVKNRFPQSLFNEEFSLELIEPMPPSSGDMPVDKTRSNEPELPHYYDRDRIMLMVRDPHWLFTYWEITAARKERFNRESSPTTWLDTHQVLRVYDVTSMHFNGANAHNHMDIYLNENVDSWYVQVSKPNHSYCIDVGRMLPDGSFITLLRSNTVTTPRAAISDCLDEQWMWIEGVYSSIGKVPFGTSSPMIVEEFALRSGSLPLSISSHDNITTKDANVT